MDNYERQLLQNAIETLAQLVGYADAKADFRPVLKMETNIIPFPVNKKTSPALKQETNFFQKIALKDINAMLVELNIKFNARERTDGRFEIRPIINGKRISIYGKTAEEIAKKYKSLLKTSKKIDKSKITLYDWIEEWLEIYKKPNIAKNTFKNLGYCIEKHIKSKLSDKPLNMYTITELTKALNQIESTRMRKYSRGILRDSFAQAVTVGYIKDSPAEKIAPVKHISKNGEAIPLLELAEMIKNAVSVLKPDMFKYFIFCLFSGARRDEALALCGGNCDFKNKIIYIPGTKSDSADRRLPMFPILEKILSDLNAAKFERVFKIGKSRICKDYEIFRGPESESVQHWLRHTFGTIQICIFDIPANTVSNWMGHADPSTTIKYYTHPEDLAPDIYYSGLYTEVEKKQILVERYNNIISIVEKLI